MATIVELGGVRPTVGEDVWLAPTAVLIGDVHVGDRASIWFGAVLRGEAAWKAAKQGIAARNEEAYARGRKERAARNTAFAARRLEEERRANRDLPSRRAR